MRFRRGGQSVEQGFGDDGLDVVDSCRRLHQAPGGERLATSVNASELEASLRLFEAAARDLQGLLGKVRSLWPPLLLAQTEAEDLVQDVLHRAVRGHTTFRGDTVDDARAWLFGIARRVIKHALWKAQRRDHTIHFVSLDEADGVESQELDGPRRCDHEEARACVMAAVDDLSNSLRLVVQLHWFEGKQIQEVAALLEISNDAVSAQIWWARVRLAKRLSEYEGEHGRSSKQQRRPAAQKTGRRSG